MAARLSELQGKEAETKATWFGEVIEFGYRPGVITMDLLDASVDKAADVSDPEAAREGNRSLRDLLEPVITWWAIQDADGQNIPVSQIIGQVPITLLTAISKAMLEDQAPPAKRR